MDVWGSNKQFQIHSFQENLKIGLSCVGKFLSAELVLFFGHTYLYKNNVSQHFAIYPALLEKYFQ